MHPLYNILETLDKAHIQYTLGRYRDDTIMIFLTVVGKRIEIEVFSNGDIETSIFSGDESIKTGINIIQEIITENAS